MVTDPNKSAQTVRWWPALMILCVAAIAGSYTWLRNDWNHQLQFMQTAGVFVVAIVLLLLWLFFFSGLSRKIRWGIFAGFVLPVLLTPALFRVRGLSGNVVPIPEFRWATPPAVPSQVMPEARFDSTATAPVSPQPSPPSARHHAQDVDDAAPVEADRETDPVSKDASTAVTNSAHDYPQFLGPHRDARKYGIKLARDWTQHPPRRLWRQAIGAGWSAFAVAGDFAVTQEQRGAQEMVVCYDLKSGKVLWTHGDEIKYESPIAGNGPRATPTIVNDLVYTLGATGLLNCLNLTGGKRIWMKDICVDNNAGVNGYGMAGSPLVFDSLVVVSAGGANGKSLVAYHRNSGQRIWSAGDDRAGYSSPLLTTLAGQPQILIFNRGNVAAHEPESGRVLWQYPWPNNTECVAQPVPLAGDRVFVTSGYGIGGKLFQIRHAQNGDWQATLVYETSRLKAKFTNVVFYREHIYGLDDGIMVCLDPANGERKWKGGRYGHGQVILVEDVVLVQAENGEVVLVEATPDAHRELTRFAAIEGKTWNNPALAGPYLLVRNDREAACYELPVE
jgi:outer membrane protein assembly factor BamB